MNTEKFKKEFCKVAGCAAALILMMLVSAAIEGTVSVLTAVLVGAGCVYALNTVCGILLPHEAQAAPVRDAQRPVSVSLRVVRGGRAA